MPNRSLVQTHLQRKTLDIQIIKNEEFLQFVQSFQLFKKYAFTFRAFTADILKVMGFLILVFIINYL